MKLRIIALRMVLILTVVVPAASNLWSQSQTGAARISGSILDDAGQPVSKVTVIARLQPSPGSPPFQASAFTAVDGSFAVTGLPAGTYTVCTQVPGSALLNPCTWSATVPTVSVAAGQTSNLAPIQLQKGTLLKVNLDDDTKSLKSEEKKKQGAHVIVGVWTQNGIFVPMRTRTNDDNGRQLELAVPAGTPLQLSVQSGSFDLKDENNAAVDPVKGASIPIQTATGSNSKVYTFKVTGRKAQQGQ